MKHCFILTETNGSLNLNTISSDKINSAMEYEVEDKHLENIAGDYPTVHIKVAELLKDNNFKVAILRYLRDIELSKTMWIAERHLTQTVKSLSDSKFLEWQNYWQALRDITKSDIAKIDFTELHKTLPVSPD
jgi:hypothetical protein